MGQILFASEDDKDNCNFNLRALQLLLFYKSYLKKTDELTNRNLFLLNGVANL